MRSPFAPVVLLLVALLAALVRWLLQGSHNMYTALAKRFYVPDPDLGWRVSPLHPLWIGLEACAVIAALSVGLIIGGWIIRRREARIGHRATVLRAAAWIVAILPLGLPIAAFASGCGPANARDTLPEAAAKPEAKAAGIAGSLDAPAGSYEVVEHPGTSISTHLSAGHEEFDARFATGIHGSWHGDPHDLTKPVSAGVSVDAAGVDTGIGERSDHARDEYLQTSKYPQITVAIDRLIAASQDGANGVNFRAHGTLTLIGKQHSIEIAGSLRKPDAAALARLKLTGDILLVQADFAVVIKDTALASDAKDFDGDRFPIHVSLVMRHTSG